MPDTTAGAQEVRRVAPGVATLFTCDRHSIGAPQLLARLRIVGHHVATRPLLTEHATVGEAGDHLPLDDGRAGTEAHLVVFPALHLHVPGHLARAGVECDNVSITGRGEDPI